MIYNKVPEKKMKLFIKAAFGSFYKIINGHPVKIKENQFQKQGWQVHLGPTFLSLVKPVDKREDVNEYKPQK
jgi:hypothetical protein